MRRIIAFSCQGETLAGTLDEATGTTGLLIVTGGNEVRVGAHRGMATLAARLATVGVPVFRFDRRGIGDSTGNNGGFRESGPDIAAALAAFRRERPGMERVNGFGNCDAATALALFGREAGLAGLILANPWVVEPVDNLPPAAAIRAHYLKTLANPSTYLRFLRGGINLGKLGRGLARMGRGDAETPLAGPVEIALTEGATVILAAGDATAIAFRAAIDLKRFGVEPVVIDTASHSFARPGDTEALERAILAVLG